MKTNYFRIFAAFSLFVSSISSFGQGTLLEYKKAIAIDSILKDKVFNAPSEFKWLDSTRLWYINNSKEGKEFLYVDAVQKKQVLAFDHNRPTQPPKYMDRFL